MVSPFAAVAGTSVESSGIFTVINPIIDLAHQEMSKILPTKKASVGALVINRFRNEIDQKTFLERMSRYGYNKDEAERELFSNKFFAGPSDLVRFMVKEAFQPELVADLIEGEPTPEKFIEEMQKHGADKDLADRYWTAHYEPMGRSDAEEAFHRLNPGQLKFKTEDISALKLDPKDIAFDFADLRRIYKLVDKYPGDRNKLAMLAYRPMTRIDIRRIDQIFDIPFEELVFLNQELGYSPTTARKLSTWTKAASLLQDIVPMLKAQEMSFDEAIKLLIAAGLPPDEARRQIQNKSAVVKKARAKKYVEKAIDEILKAVVNKKISSANGITSLVKLGLTSEEAAAEIKIAAVVAKGDPEHIDEVDEMINHIRSAAGLPQFATKSGKNRIVGYIYTMILEDEQQTQKDLQTMEEYGVGERIIDHETGKYGKITRKESIKESVGVK